MRLPTTTPLLSLLALTSAQSTLSVSPAQSTSLNALLASYASSLSSSPAATSLAINLVLVPDFRAADLTALIPFPTTSIDYASLATAPPSVTTEPAWFSNAPADVQSDIRSLQNSAVNAAVGIVRSGLGLEATTFVAVAAAPAAASSSSAAAARGRFVDCGRGWEVGMGMAAGVVGALAVAL